VSPERSYRRLSPLTPLVRSFLVLVAGVAATWDDVLRGDLGIFAWAFVGLVVAGAAYGTASWLRTRYWIEADELRVDTGVISRQSRRIRVDRLQGIDIVQPLAARVLGLAELRMDVAGGGPGEGSLAFLRLEDAQLLREVLLARRDAVRAARGPVATRALGGAGPGEPGVAPPAAEQVLARLDLATLLVSLLLSVETVLFVLAALALGVVFVAVGSVGGAAGVVPVLGGFVLTQFRKLSAYHGFTVSRTSGGLQVRRGLFELSSQTVALARVQGVVVSEPLLWRGFGWARLDVSVAGAVRSDGEDGPSASTVLPVAPRAVVLQLARTLLGEAGSPDLDVVPLSPPPPRSRWVAPLARRFSAAGTGEDLVVSRGGVWNRRTHAVPHARVQSLQLHQGPWQRRLGLADLRVDSPPGPVQVRARHRDAEEARRWLDRESLLTRAARQGSPLG
jgi:putative membrane protein